MAEAGITRPIIRTRIERPDLGLVGELARLGVATVLESLGPVLGPHQTMAGVMRRRTTRKAVAGPAITAASGLTDNLMMHAALRTAQPGDVLVVGCRESPGAQFGELAARGALVQGVIGVVTDGAVRDVDAIDDLGLPVWAHVVAPHGAKKEVLGWVNEPVNCSGVRVEPGDVVVADGDGVVVVPRLHIPAAVAAGRQRAAREDRSREATREGRLPGELSGIYDRLDASDVEVIDEPWTPSAQPG